MPKFPDEKKPGFLYKNLESRALSYYFQIVLGADARNRLHFEINDLAILLPIRSQSGAT